MTQAAPNSSYAPSGSGFDRSALGGAIPFVLAHLVCLAAIWTGVYLTDLLIALGLYALRVFAITGGHHRYFSHRAFKTSRVFQFILAVLAQTSVQRGVLWWAAVHRHHHKYSDTEEDVHSPARKGFWYSHVGWIFDPGNGATDYSQVPDLARYRELRWLDKYHVVPGIALGALVWLAAGWSGLVVGFFWSTVAVWHSTYTINSLSHVFGKQRYLTGDTSRNNIWLALLTFGEGWHNNHHHYQSAACQGFRWYEIDITYYILKALAAMGLIWDLKRPPEAVVRNEKRVGRTVVEKAAQQLAASFSAERIAADLRAAIAEKRLRLEKSVDDLGHRVDSWQSELNRKLGVWQQEASAIWSDWQDRAQGSVGGARHEIEALVERVHLPSMPTMSDLRARANAMLPETASMNEVVDRAWQLLLERVDLQLKGGTPPQPTAIAAA